MKIINKKERVYNDWVERYELNDLFIGIPGFINGALILHLLVNHTDTKLSSFYLSEDGELGADRSIISGEGEAFTRYFPSVDEMMENVKSYDLSSWDISLIYQNEEISISGRIWSNVVGVSYRYGSNPQILKLLSEVEEASYDYHRYDARLVDLIKHKFNQKQKMAIKTIMKLEAHGDILEEFTRVLASDRWPNPSGAITVSGFTAERLYNDYPLSLLGAYNYLIYLREAPKEALEDLRRGLPRK